MYLFRPVISNTALLDEHPARKVQGMVPDFMYHKTQILADLKTMTCCKSHYPPSRFRNAERGVVVSVRGRKVHSEYHTAANKIDRTYNDYQGSRGSGPVSLKLASYGRIRGLAVGAFGEGSEDLYQLCKQMAKSAAPTRYADMGACEMSDAVARALRHIYRVVGIETMRGIASLRTYRMAKVLAGTPDTQLSGSSRQKTCFQSFMG